MSKKYRIWKLGSLEHRLYPSQEAIDKLRKVIEGPDKWWEKKEALDIIWGPDLEVQEIGTEDGEDTIESYVVKEIIEDNDELRITARKVKKE